MIDLQALGTMAGGLGLFHTTFNLIGVLLTWPLAERLTRWLQQRLRAREEDEAQPQFLDDTVLAVPTLALDALPPLMAADARLAAAAVAFVEATSSLLLQCDPTGAPDVARLDTHLGTMEARYEDLQDALLAAGADARLALTDMEQALRRCSALRRAAQQLHKARRRLAEGATP